MRLIVLAVVFCSFLWSATEIEIVKTAPQITRDYPPSLIVLQTQKGSASDAQTHRIDALLRQDLNVLTYVNIDSSSQNVPFGQMVEQYKANGVKWGIFVTVNRHNEGIAATLKVVDVNSSNIVLNTSYAINAMERYPFMVHRLANDVAAAMNYPRVPWMEKMVIYSVTSGRRLNDIIVADYTFAFQKKILSGGMYTFPKWGSPKQEGFFYTDSSSKPTLYYYNLYSGEKKAIASSDGMIVCSDVSKDGSKLLLTMAPNGQPDIYIYDRNKVEATRITTYNGIDVGGQFIDKDSKIAFISDRLGYPTIFTSSLEKINGVENVEQAVFSGRYNTSLSSHESMMVYAGASTNGYQVYSQSTQNHSIRQLTTDAKNVMPRISSTGDAILYIRQSSSGRGLGLIRLPSGKNFVFPAQIAKIGSIDW